MTDSKIAVAGHICLDITPKFPDVGASRLGQILVPGSLIHVGECVVSTGGPVANTGLALVKLGLSPTLMGKVGRDSFGHIVVEILEAHGCGEGVIRVEGEQTAYTIVIAPPNIDRVFLHNPGANNAFGAGDVDYEAVEKVGIFHLGYPPLLARMFADGGRELEIVLRRACKRGATTSLDMSLPDPESPSGRADWDGILRRVLPHVDLFLPSIEETLYFLQREEFMQRRAEAAEGGGDLIETVTASDCSRLGRRLVEYGAGVVLLKCGHRGIYARTGSAERLARLGRASIGQPKRWAAREFWVPPFQVERVASATGSGDSAIAGFLAAFLDGRGPELAVKCAAAVGALNVTAHDSTSGLTSYEQTMRRMPDMPVGDLNLDGDGWYHDRPAALWRGPAD